MRYSKKNARVLQLRLATLKNTYGKSLRGFPPRFFVQQPRSTTSLRQPPSFNKPTVSFSYLSKQPDQALLLRNDASFPTEVPTRADGTRKEDIERDSALGPIAAFIAVTSIFSTVRQTDVLQKAGQQETNVGELSPSGTSNLIEICASQSDDVFLDVGYGIGNILVQVALQTPAKLAIGIEVRANGVHLGKKLVQDALVEYSRLQRVFMFEGDIVVFDVGSTVAVQTSVLFANNLLFTQLANQALHELCCQLPYLRLVLLVDRPCLRHRSRCTKAFCAMWKERPDSHKLETEFRQQPLVMAVYERKWNTHIHRGIEYIPNSRLSTSRSVCRSILALHYNYRSKLHVRELFWYADRRTGSQVRHQVMATKVSRMNLR